MVLFISLHTYSYRLTFGEAEGSVDPLFRVGVLVVREFNCPDRGIIAAGELNE
jgi:hypothetical protein